jgi:hypothetical protein
MISADKPWGDATSGCRSWAGMKRALEPGADARVDQIWIEHRTDMGWTPTRAEKSEVEMPD